MAKAKAKAIKKAQAQDAETSPTSVYEVTTMPISMIDSLTQQPVRVDEQSVLQSIPALAAVLCIAEAMGSLPMHVYRRLEPYGKARDKSHPLYPLLHDSPNDDMSAQAWVETMMLHALLWGNAYSVIDRDELGRPVGLYPLLPDRTAPVRDENGNLYYVTKVGGKIYPLFAADVFHIMGPSLSGWLGINRVIKTREALGIGVSADKYAAKAYAHGIHPSGVITHPQGIGPKAAENLRSDVQRQHQGLDNFFKVIVLQEGATFHPFNLDLEKNQMIEARRFSVEDAGRLWRVPSILLNHTKDSNYSIGEATMRYFVTMTLRPWGRRFRLEAHRKLFTAEEQATHFVEMLYDDLLTGDYSAKATYYRELYNLGAITAAEIRERENLNPYEGNVGSEPVINGAYTKLADVGRQFVQDNTRSLDLDDAYLTARQLAEHFGVNRNALYNRLARWREKNDEGWIEVRTDDQSQPQHLYSLRAVRPLFEIA